MFSKKNIIYIFIILISFAIFVSCTDEQINENLFKINFVTNADFEIESCGSTDIDKIVIPEREGYEFVDWYIDYELTVPFNKDTIINRDITLYAKWTVKKINVNIIVKNEIKKTYNFEYGNKLSGIDIPTLTGYTFDGFYFDEEFTKKYDENEEVVVEKDINLYTKWTVISYSVVTIIDGIQTEEYMLEYGSKLSTIERPHKEHYTFDGWYRDKGCTTQYTPYATVDGDKKLYARFIPDPIMIELVDGNNITSSKYGYNDLISDIKLPTKEGYTFDGFYYDKDFSLKANDTDHLTTDVTLYIKWNINKYKVTIYIDSEIYEIQEISYKDKILDVIKPAKEHYTLDGWYDSTYQSKYKDETEIMSDITLYGKFVVSRYSVKIYSNNELVIDEDYEYGTLLSTIKIPNVEGHIFIGYFLESSDAPIDLSYKIDRNVVLIAKWEISKFTVTRYVDGIMIDTNQYVYKTLLSAIKLPTKEHFKFDGWYFDAECTTKADSNLQITNDLVIYGKFEIIEVNVSVYSDGVLYSNTKVNHGDLLSKITKPIKFGHTLVGLYYDEKMTNLCKDEDMITSDLILYAKWKINQYKVTIVVNGEIKSVLDVDYNSKIYDIESPTVEHYTFIGWYDTNDQLIDKEELVKSDTTLIAKYELEKLTIKVIVDDKVYSTTIVQYGDLISTIEKPTKKGYTFDGYYSDSELLNIISMTDKIETNLTLYTKWNVNKYLVKVIIDGNTISNESYDYGTQISSFIKPTKEHYDFFGWYEDATCKTLYSNDAIVDGNITIYGKFELVNIKVSYYDGTKLLSTVYTKYGTTFEQTQKPVKTGYTIVGYYLDSACSDVINNSYVIIDELTIYTKWSINSYTVSVYFENVWQYDKNITYGVKVSYFEKPTKENYDFNWYTDSTYKTKISDSKIITSDIKLYGHFTVKKVTINFYDGNTIIKKVSVETGTLLKDVMKPTKMGYTLQGLYTNSSCTTLYDENDVITGTTTIYTKWTINQYEVKIYIDNVLTETIMVNYNTLLSSFSVPSKNYYDFDGWYSSNDFSKKFGNAYTIIGNVSIYGRFNPKTYTVSLNSDGKVISKINLKYGDTIGMITKPTKVGHTFENYYLDSSFVTVINDDYVIDQNITIYIKWKVNIYEVSIIVDGITYGTLQIEYGTTMKEVEVPTRNDYLFMGWFEDISLVKQVDDNYVITRNITVYTKWMNISSIKYTTEYYLENLENNDYSLFESAITTGRYNTEVSAIIKSYVGFTVVDTNIKGTILLDGSLVLKVYYTRNIRSVTYMYDNLIYKVEHLKYGSKYEIISDKLIKGYIFNGWYSDDEFKIPAHLNLITDQDEVIYGKVEKIIEGTPGLKYELNEDGISYSIVGYDGTISDVVIPNGYEYYPITIISTLSESIIIEKLTISENVLIIDNMAIANCIRLTEINLPNSLETINTKAFYNCSSLKTLTFGENVSTFGVGAFNECINLESINVSNSNEVYSSDNGILYNKDKTILIYYPVKITTTNVVFPVSVKTIARSALNGNLFIKSLDLTNITDIMPENFSGCAILQVIMFGKDIQYINDMILNDAVSLTTIIVDEDNKEYKTVDGILYTSDMSILIKYPSGKLDNTYIVPESVVAIKYNTFNECKNLLNVVLHKNIRYLETGAFNSLNTSVFTENETYLDSWSLYAFTRINKIVYKPNWTIENDIIKGGDTNE